MKSRKFVPRTNYLYGPSRGLLRILPSGDKDIVNSFYRYLIFSKTFSGFFKTFKTAHFWRFRPSDDSPWELVSFFGKFKINTCQFRIFSGKSCGFGRLSKLWIWNNLDLRLLYKLIYDLLLFFGSLEWMTFDSKYSPKIWGVWWF